MIGGIHSHIRTFSLFVLSVDIVVDGLLGDLGSGLASILEGCLSFRALEMNAVLELESPGIGGLKGTGVPGRLAGGDAAH